MFSITDKTAAPQYEQFYCSKLIFPTLVCRNSRYNQSLYMQLYIVTALFIPRAYLTGCILMNIPPPPFTLLARPTFSPIRFFPPAVCRTHGSRALSEWLINRFWINYSRLPTETADCPEDLSGNRYTRSGTISKDPGQKVVVWYDRKVDYQYTCPCVSTIEIGVGKRDSAKMTIRRIP